MGSMKASLLGMLMRGLFAVGGKGDGAVEEQGSLGDFGDESVEFRIHGNGEAGVFVGGWCGFVLDDVVDVVGEAFGAEVVKNGGHAAVASVDGVDLASGDPVGPQRRGRGVAEHEAADLWKRSVLPEFDCP